MNPVIDRMHTLLSVLQPDEISITDDSHRHAGHAGARSGGGHYLLTITASAFSGISVPARHRMIYSALGSMMGREIHALSITATSPDVYDTTVSQNDKD